MPNKAPETGACVVWCVCRRAAGCRAGRPFSGVRHGHVARRAGGDRGAHASRIKLPIQREISNVCTEQVLESVLQQVLLKKQQYDM